MTAYHYYQWDSYEEGGNENKVKEYFERIKYHLQHGLSYYTTERKDDRILLLRVKDINYWAIAIQIESDFEPTRRELESYYINNWLTKCDVWKQYHDYISTIPNKYECIEEINPYTLLHKPKKTKSRKQKELSPTAFIKPNMDYTYALQILRNKYKIDDFGDTKYEMVSSTDSYVIIQRTYENKYRTTTNNYKVHITGEVEELNEYTDIEGKECPF
jgi:hypothetical protein